MGNKQDPNPALILPVFINEQNRIRMFFICGVLCILGYTIPNHFHFFTPQELPLSDFDRMIPLVPWTIFVYISEYLLFVSAYFALSNDLNRNKYIWTLLWTIVGGALVFVFWPTTYPRADFPLPAIGDGVDAFTHQVFSTLRAIDNPSNCFPSMHVAGCFVTAMAFWDKAESKAKFWFYIVWALAVAVSTLPTKQHYLVDVLGGMFLAAVAYWVLDKKTQYVTLNEWVQMADQSKLITAIRKVRNDPRSK